MRAICARKTVLLASFLWLLSACGGGPVEPALTVRVEHRVNGVPLGEPTLDTPFTNAAGNAFGVTRLVYFLSDLSLRVGGGEALLGGAHLVDHGAPETHALPLSLQRRSREGGTLTFVMGLPEALNVPGAFPTAPQSLMEWPEELGGGYHHMKFEGRYVDGEGNLAPFKVHSGPTGGADHSFQVTLAVPAEGEGDVLTVVMNLEQWFVAPHTWDLREKLPPPMHGMMADGEKQRELRDNGGTVFTLEAP